MAEGIDPASAQGRARVDAIVTAWAQAAGEPDAPERRAQLLDDLETFTDRRVNRFWQLVAIVHGDPQPAAATKDPTYDAVEWLIGALRAAARY